jgi:hypothetical protein
MMAPKEANTRANSSLDVATKATLAAKKGKVTFVDNILPLTARNNGSEAANSKRPRTEDLPTQRVGFTPATLRAHPKTPSHPKESLLSSQSMAKFVRKQDN